MTENAPMFEFTIEYYFQIYHTGALDTDNTRKAIVCANCRSEAYKKVKLADSSYICCANLSFREINSGG